MPWQQRVGAMIGMPVGISLVNGQGTSGILCSISGNTLYVIEYMYQNQFSMQQYSANMIQDVNPFPSCPYNPQPVY